MSKFMEAVAAVNQEQANQCKVHAWLKDNPDVTTAELREARDKYTTRAVWVVMRERGFEASQEVVSKHLRGECKCLSSVK